MLTHDNDGAGSASTGPANRLGHGLAYDAANGCLLLFGGFRASGVPLDDTWLLDSDGWRMSAARGPTARRWPALTSDALRGTILLTGGRAGIGRAGAALDDTWLWDGARWTQLADSGPAPRAFPGMAHEPGIGRSTLFGGWDGSNYWADTWLWNGTAWTPYAVEGPAGRVVYMMAHDPARRACVFYGGGQHIDGAWQLANETWEWRQERWRRIA